METQVELADGPRRHGAAPRPALRRRAAPRPQPRHRRQAGLPRRHQRAGVRGLRRLRRQEQLPVRAAGRHAVRAQDPHPPDELQLRHVVPAGRLPGVRHRHASTPTAPSRPGRPPATTRRPRRRAARSRCRRCRPTPSRCACRASAAPASSRSARCSARRRCSTATSCAASTRPGCRRRRARSSATCASAAATSRRRTTPTAPASTACWRSTCSSRPATPTASAPTRSRTIVVGSVASTPTGAMVAHPTTPYPDLGALTGRLDEVSRADHNRYVDAAGAGHRAVRRRDDGQHPAARRRRAGRRRSPSSPAAIERAIELNGVAVARNVAAFRWGRRWAAFPAEVEQAAGIAGRRRAGDDRRADRPARRRPRRLPVRRATPGASATSSAWPAQAEQRVDPASTAFTAAVARYGHKLMAYKDEYEVARLLLAPEAARRVRGGRRAGHEGHVAAAPADAAGRWA